jgi:hypothetical protein
MYVCMYICGIFGTFKLNFGKYILPSWDPNLFRVRELAPLIFYTLFSLAETLILISLHKSIPNLITKFVHMYMYIKMSESESTLL